MKDAINLIKHATQKKAKRVVARQAKKLKSIAIKQAKKTKVALGREMRTILGLKKKGKKR